MLLNKHLGKHLLGGVFHSQHPRRSFLRQNPAPKTGPPDWHAPGLPLEARSGIYRPCLEDLLTEESSFFISRALASGTHADIWMVWRCPQPVSLPTSCLPKTSHWKLQSLAKPWKHHVSMLPYALVSKYEENEVKNPSELQCTQGDVLWQIWFLNSRVLSLRHCPPWEKKSLFFQSLLPWDSLTSHKTFQVEARFGLTPAHTPWFIIFHLKPHWSS